MVPAWFIYKEDVYYQFEGKYFKLQGRVKSFAIFQALRLSEKFFAIFTDDFWQHVSPCYFINFLHLVV